MATKQTIHKGSKVQFKVGRGKLIGKVVEIDENIAFIKPDKGGAKVSRKLDLLRAAKA